MTGVKRGGYMLLKNGGISRRGMKKERGGGTYTPFPTMTWISWIPCNWSIGLLVLHFLGLLNCSPYTKFSVFKTFIGITLEELTELIAIPCCWVKSA